jgi:major cell surface glycoprotein (TIGR04216 family)
MNRKYRITTVLIALVVAVSMAAFAAPVAAQSADNVQTTLSDNNGDGLDDRVQVDVTVSDAARTEIVLDEGNFDVDVSPTADQGAIFQEIDTDGDGTPEAVQIDEVGGASTTYTVVADLSGQADGDTGTADVDVNQGADTLSETYTVQDTGGGTTPPPGASGAERTVRQADGNGENRVFLGEDNIDEQAGVFAGRSPGSFQNDGVPLEIDAGTVDPNQDTGTYFLNDDPNNIAVQVREPRVQNIRFIDGQTGERLDVDEARVEQGDNNLQVGVDYNYYSSTTIDETLTQDGSDVTSIYLEEVDDRGFEAGDPANVPAGERDAVEALDGTDYDAVFTFSLDDTGEYTISIAPLDGTDRDDGRDIGFVDREDVEQSEVITIIDDDDVEIELDGDEGNQGARVSYEMLGALEGEAAPVTIEADDLRFDAANFGDLLVQHDPNDEEFDGIDGDDPIEFSRDAFRLTDEGVNHGHIFRALESNPLGLGFEQNELIVANTQNIANVEVYDAQGNVVAQNLNFADGGAQRTALEDALNNDNIRLERVYAIVERDDGVASSEVDTKVLDDTGVDVEIHANGNGQAIDLGQNGVPGVASLMFDGADSFADDQDEATLDVLEAGLTVDQPPQTYVPGMEEDITGSITGGVDQVDVFVRDRDNYFLVTSVNTDRSEGSYEETDFDLANDAVTQDARDILGQPGNYRYGVIDGIDVDITALRTGDVVRGINQDDPDGLDSSDFNGGASTQRSIRVAPPSLAADFATYDGQVYKPDGVDVTGEIVGPRDYLVWFADDRGNVQIEQFSADSDDGSIEEEALDLTDLRDGTIEANVLSPGRDTVLGDGTFRLDEELAEEAFGGEAGLYDASLSNFRRIAVALGTLDRTQTQVLEIIRDQTVDQAGSDDLIEGQTFRISDDSRTSIESVVPSELEDQLSGVQTIEVGETMVVGGLTNRNPEDATIVVEAEQGPSIAELGTEVTDEWPADDQDDETPGGEWSVEIPVSEEVEPGNYTIRSDDGERIDEQTVEIVAEGTLEEGERLQDEAEQLQAQIDELEGQLESVRNERDELQNQVSELESTNSDLEDEIASLESDMEDQQDQQNNGTDTDGEDTEEEGQPGFTAVAALVALVAVALLALRRREE